MVKKGINHEREDHLSQFLLGEALNGILHDLLDSYLFNIKMIHKWRIQCVPMLEMRTLNITQELIKNYYLTEQSCK